MFWRQLACVAFLWCGVLVPSAFADGTAADIQALIDAAEPGATVTIPSGTYALEASVKVDKAITLAGASRAGVVLDGQDAVNGLEVTASGAVVKDLTVTRGAGGVVSDSSRMGAGIYAVAGTRIENCAVTKCLIEVTDTSSLYGAGVWSAGEIVDTTIAECTLYKHPSTSNNNDCRGAGVYLSGGTLSDSVVTGCVNNAAQASGEAQSGKAVRGGGVYATNGSTVEDCEILGNSIVDNLTGSSRKDIGLGGGIVADGAATVIRRSLVKGNRTPTGAAGILLTGGAVEDCSVISNVLATIGTSYPYAAIVVEGGSIVRSRIVGNRQGEDGTAGERQYGVAVEFRTSAGQLRDSLVADNLAANGGIVAFIASGCLVSNCVLRGNSVSSQGSVFGTKAPESVSGAVIRDCWIVDNLVSGSYGAAAYVMGSGSSSAAKDGGDTFAFRNCYFARNTSGSGNKNLFYVYNTKNAGIKAENCTFVDNANLGVFSISSAPDSPASCALRNCLVYANGGTVVPASMVTAGVVSNSAVDVTTGFSLPDAYGNVDLSQTLASRVFRKYPQGDYSLSPKAASLIDLGSSAAPAWATDAHDLGNGSYTLTDSGAYGVTISAVKPKPRLVNGRIDIGASEYEFEKGDDEDPTEPYAPGETLPVFADGSSRIAAILAEAATVGEKALVPKGVYQMSGPVTLTAEMRSLARHSGAVVLDFQNGSAGLFCADMYSLEGVTVRNATTGCAVSGFGDIDYADGSATDYITTAQAGAGICFTSGNSVITNCVVENCVLTASGHALGAGLFSRGKVYATIVRNCRLVETATGKAVHGGGAFLSGGRADGLIVSNCAVWGWANGINGRGALGGGALGGFNAVVANGRFTDSCVTNANTSGRTEGYGGGVTMFGGELRNSLVAGNWTHAGGGGVWARYNALVEDCTITNNALRSYYQSGTKKDDDYAYGSNLGLVGNAGSLASGCARARRCLLAKGTSDHTYDRAPGASGPVAFGGAGELTDCVVEDNDVPGSVFGSVNGRNCSQCLISNCVIRANSQTAARGCLFNPIVAANGEFLVRDCWIVENTLACSGYPALLTMTLGMGGATAPIRFQNCLIANNTNTAATAYFANYYNSFATIELDGCTVVGNTAVSVAKFNTSGWESHFACSNTVFYGNGNNGTAKTLVDTATGTRLRYTAVDNPANVTCDATTGNVDLSTQDPKFRPGSVMPRARSPLANAGHANAWATPKGVKSLGNGSYAVSASGDWGVTVTRKGSTRRVKDAQVDIGCAEMKGGMVLMIR